MTDHVQLAMFIYILALRIKKKHQNSQKKTAHSTKGDLDIQTGGLKVKAYAKNKYNLL